MKVLVTGATGFLGGPLVDRLLAQGERDLRITVRPGSKRARVEAAAARYPDARVEYVQANLTVPSEVARAVEGVGAVYHLAASLRGAPADMFLNTVVGSKILLDAVAAAKPRIILISSFSVYGVADLGRGALVDESTPLEPHPEKRDLYAHVKLREELLFRERAARDRLPLVILRPGVIYGPGGGAFSSRVGLNMFGLFLSLGGNNRLPLSYVDNCAEAIALAGRTAPASSGGGATEPPVYNLVDDDLPTCREYLAAYQKAVAPVRALPVPYPVLSLGARLLEKYNRWSRGQLPAIFTPYKVASTWGGNRFDNAKIKALGWRPLVPTAEGLQRAFAWLKEQVAASGAR
jgi:nucleoside-diphosphate-sugar epimerase